MGAMTEHALETGPSEAEATRSGKQAGPVAVPSSASEGVRPAAQSRTCDLPPLAGILTALTILGCSRSTLYRWLEADKMIRPQYIDSGPVWVRSEVEEFAAARNASQRVAVAVD